MKTVSAALLAHLKGPLTTTCTLLRLSRLDGTEMGFTDHVADTVYDDGNGELTYSAGTGYTRSAIQAASDLSVPNLSVDWLLDSAAITADDLRAGVYDFAELRVYLVNYEDLTQGHLYLQRAKLGEVTLKGGVFTAEVRGLAQALQTNFVEVFTADCLADLGDARCKVDLAAFTETGTVDSVAIARRQFTATITGARADGFFNGGALTWTSGANNGIKCEVKLHAAGPTLTLFLPTGKTIAVGDTFSVARGCDKTRETCRDIFANLDNFRGFPDIPGMDAVLQTPNAT